MSLPLRVFEDRYKALLHDCQQSDHRFGAVLIRDGQEVGGPSTPYEIGTIAEIVTVNSSDDGIYHIEAAGRERFHARSLHYDRPYLWCRAEMLADVPGDRDEMLAQDVRVRALMATYVDLLIGSMGSGHERYHLGLPDDCAELSYAAAMLLRVGPIETQALLEAATVADRLALEVELLGREMAILRRMLRMHREHLGRDRSTYVLN